MVGLFYFGDAIGSRHVDKMADSFGRRLVHNSRNADSNVGRAIIANYHFPRFTAGLARQGLQLLRQCLSDIQARDYGDRPNFLPILSQDFFLVSNTVSS